MYATLLGNDGFQKGMKLYFQRHDGQAVTCDDFRAAMADANGVSDGLAQFEEWYMQAGTPEVVATSAWEQRTGIYSLTLQQACPPSAGQPNKRPFHIPVAVGLIDRRTGADVPLRLRPRSGGGGGGGGDLCELTNAQQTFEWQLPDLAGGPAPVLSLLRDFSAPVKTTVVGQTAADLAYLMAHDTDSFVRWDSAQQLAKSVLFGLVDQLRAAGVDSAPLTLDETFVQAARDVLRDGRSGGGVDPSLIAYTMSLPTEGMLADDLPAGEVDPGIVHAAREFAMSALSSALHEELLATYAEHGGRPYGSGDAADVGRRRLANMALRLLCAGGTAEAMQLAQTQLQRADNMTDEAAAFECLLLLPPAAAASSGLSVGQVQAAAISAFEAKWGGDALVMDSWFSMQARAVRGEGAGLERVRELMQHPAWSLTNPNKMRSLIGGVAMGNPSVFHAADGSGYDFLASVICALDQHNPQMAARQTTAFRTWRRLEPGRRVLAQHALQRIQAAPGLSADTLEVVTKSLAPVVHEVEEAAQPLDATVEA
jgi:aminopeptidase N